MKVEEAINQYKKSDGFNRLAGNTKRAYGFAEKHLAAFKHRMVEDIKRSDVVAFGENAKGKASARMAMVLLRNAINYAYDRDLVAKKLDTRIATPKQVSHARWTDEEIETALREASKPVRDLILLTLYTGQRKSDVINMKWSDYDGRYFTVVQKKTGKRVQIPVHERLLHGCIPTKPKAGRTGTILTTRTGHAWTEGHATRSISRLCKRCLSRPLTLHGLRHTAASILAECGLTPPEIAAITGHSSIREVARYIAGANQRTMAEKAMAKWSER